MKLIYFPFAFLLQIVFFSTLSVAASPERNNESPECKNRIFPFVHCADTVQNFETLMLAIHGWGGSCETTFGEHENSLFRVLSKDKFFDIDCFQYDSYGTSIDENAQRLRNHLGRLSRLGYKAAMIVTHSMGGLVALHAYTDNFLDKNGNQLRVGGANSAGLPKDFVFAGINAWAIPIDGLRPYVLVAGQAAKIPVLREIAKALLGDTNFSTETLPDLEPRSNYLRTLKNRLNKVGDMRKHRNNFPREWRMNLGMPVRLFVGQGDDSVVRPIDVDQGRSDGWLWPDIRLVHSAESHNNNIGNPTTSKSFGLPRYPTEIVRLTTLLNLPVSPRYEQVFPEDVRVVLEPLESRQVAVVKGLNYVARESIIHAYTTAVKFLKRMFQKSFPRSPKVDTLLISGFLESIKWNTLNDDLIGFYDRIIKEVFDGFQPVKKGENRKDVKKRFSSGYTKPQQMVIEVVVELWQRIREYIGDSPRRIALLRNYGGSLSQFDGAMAALTGNFLQASHDKVRERALQALALNLPKMSNEAVKESKIALVINRYYYYGNLFDKLPSKPKKLVAAIYRDLVSRPAETSGFAIAALQRVVSYRGKQSPLIVTLNDNLLVRKSVARLFQASPYLSENIKFLSAVAAHGGATGNDPRTAAFALDTLGSIGGMLADNKFKALTAEAFTRVQRETKFEALKSSALGYSKAIQQ